MAAKRFTPADWGEPDDVCNRVGNPLFKTATLKWSTPQYWNKDAEVELGDEAALYILVRNHGNASRRDLIQYVGLASSLKSRFKNHSTAQKIRAKRGETYISVAPIDFIRGSDKLTSQKRAMEELEHLLIWALNPPENDRKHFTLPGMGSHRSNAWHVTNTGHRFCGQMPKQIVFPWMLLKLGRNVSLK